MLDLSSLEKALSSLDRAILRAEANTEDEELRDATIQRFESSFELSWKMLKRCIEADAANSSAVDAMSFRELMREGFERGYIAEPEEWFLFGEHRNTVAQVYNESKAKIVYQSALKFEKAAKLLLAKLKEKHRE